MSTYSTKTVADSVHRTSRTREAPDEQPSLAPIPSGRSGAGRKARWAGQTARWLVNRLLTALGGPPVSVRLWHGDDLNLSPDPPVARVTVHDRWAMWRLAANPLFQFGELYSAGRLDVDGDLVDLAVAVGRSLKQQDTSRFLSRVLNRCYRLPRLNTPRTSRGNVHHHYDIGNDFYALWLDRQMVYTCAYFASPRMTLEQAQTAKFDHICRKLRLAPGEHVVDAGCGWGALAMHMARTYGVTVHAYNISHQQMAYARHRARELGVQDRVRFIEKDWRHIEGRFDVFVSVGMLEHVGPSNYRRLGDVIDRCLETHGRGLIHSIGRNKPFPPDRWIERRIFPGGYPPSLEQMMAVFQPHDLSVLDVENLRLHYAQTLRHWLERYEQAEDQIRSMFDERFVRMWRLYLAGSIAAFEIGDMQLFQVLFARGQNNDIPRTRDHIYATHRPVRQISATDRRVEG